jgi:hypothetical protein
VGDAWGESASSSASSEAVGGHQILARDSVKLASPLACFPPFPPSYLPLALRICVESSLVVVAVDFLFARLVQNLWMKTFSSSA